jgi:hypothetical protein
MCVFRSRPHEWCGRFVFPTFVSGGCLSGKLLLVLASTTVFGSEAFGTGYHILLSHVFCVFVPQWKCVPDVHSVQDFFVAMLCIPAHVLLVHLSPFSAIGIMTELWAGHPRFYFEREHEMFLFSTALGSALGLTQPRVQWISGYSAPYFCVMPMLTVFAAILPPHPSIFTMWCLIKHGDSSTNVTCTLYILYSRCGA